MNAESGNVQRLIQQFESVTCIDKKIKKTTSCDGLMVKNSNIHMRNSLRTDNDVFKEVAETNILEVNRVNGVNEVNDIEFDLTPESRKINGITSLPYYVKCLENGIDIYHDWYGQELIDDRSKSVIEVYNYDMLEPYLCNANNYNLLTTGIFDNDREKCLDIEGSVLLDNFERQSTDANKLALIRDKRESLNNYQETIDNQRDTLENLRRTLENYENSLENDPNNKTNKYEKYDSEIVLSDNVHPIIINKEKIQDANDHIYDTVEGYYYNDKASIYQTLDEQKDKLLTRPEMIIKELIETEKNYLSILRCVITDYMDYFDENLMPSHLIGRSSYLFGNIKNIYTQSLHFYDELLHCNHSWNLIADSFIKHKHLFELYPIYAKNKPGADVYIRNDFFDILEERRTELNQPFDLESNLMAPIQRLPKYMLLLENIKKELYKMGVKKVTKLIIAINIIKEELNKGNDYIAIESIHEWPVMNKMDLGPFIMRDIFIIRNPRKFESMIFLFNKMLVFTTMDNNRNFCYKSSINLSEIGLAVIEYDPLEFHIIQYTHNNNNKKKKKKGTTYIFEAKSPGIKEIWINQIHEMLSEQFNQYKKKQIIIYQQEGKRCSAHPL